MQQAQYDFPVSLRPLFLAGQEHPIPKVMSVVREDSLESIGVVSDRYRLITHPQALNIVKPFTDALGNAEVKHMLEKNGARLVSQFTYRDRTAQIPSVGDTVALRVNVINSYDGSEPLKFNIGALVLRCLNGMMALQESIDLRYRHTGQWSLDDITLPDPSRIWDRFVRKTETWDRWTSIPSNGVYVDNVLKRLMASAVIGTKFIQEHKSALDTAPTRWDFYDQMTYAITHKMVRIKESERIRRLRALDYIFSTTTTDAEEDAA